MRYARHLVALVAAAGFIGAGAAWAAPPDDNPSSPPPSSMDQQPMDQHSSPSTAPSPSRSMDEAPPPSSQTRDQNSNLPCCETAQPPPANPTVIVVQPPPSKEVVVQPQPRRKRWRGNRVFSPYETALVIGSGGADFISDTMSGSIHAGPAWNARVTVGTRSFLAFEAGYMGTYNRTEGSIAPGGSAPYILSNAFESDLRINLLPWRVEPYIFGGVGYSHFSLENGQNDPQMAARFRSSTDNVIVPAGGGLAFYIGRHFTLDGRFTYHAVFNNNILLVNPNGDRADQWTAGGNLGWAF